jgi:hypothetical protein
MIYPTANVQSANGANTIFSGVTSSAPTTSFAQQLATALEQYLGQAGNGTQLEIDIQPAASQDSATGRQDSATGQYVVTVTTPQSSSSTGISATSTSSTSTSSTTTSSTGADATPATQDTSSENQESGMVTIPFGTGTTTVPTLATELANFNTEAANMNLSSSQILAEDALTEQGDPFAGMTIPGTNLSWENLTQNQQVAYMYAMDYGMPAGESMQDYLAANVGPQTMANAPNADPTMFGTS